VKDELPEPAGMSRGMQWMLAATAVFLVVGTVAGVFLFPGEWSWMRRALGGLVIGAGCALMILSWRLLVYDGDDV
jgi:hypothetical protein